MWTAGFDKPEKSRVNIPPSKRRRGDGLTTVVPTQKGSDKHEKPRVIHPSKRRRRSGLKNVSPTQNGTEDINELEQPDDQNHEDGLTRTVAVFASALEKFKTKMHTGTNKKSSEILASVAEEIQLQLQNVNSQINRDVLKFTNLSKSKRKSLETRFQEQHEQLKSIQCKFKEEVAQHLQECKSTLEDLEAFQIELKGNAKKQKALHQKILLQVEEAIEKQLTDADKRITDIHKGAREKMCQLKHVITEGLKGGFI
ncbi:hypothetical protein AQUCO_00300260v1 [Aquilegia coerulea]|uniref:Meiosis-specific protein ASY3-like coiled-coil domain-containing protein n=1 Tax=Aquilegia coerulea TaxID=218851 RepID=A0A2G5EXZ2_AQUCA|nr:hypothetical protein AQUCO_00300260v1 [Aquilegia coerulea]